MRFHKTDHASCARQLVNHLCVRVTKQHQVLQTDKDTSKTQNVTHSAQLQLKHIVCDDTSSYGSSYSANRMHHHHTLAGMQLGFTQRDGEEAIVIFRRLCSPLIQNNHSETSFIIIICKTSPSVRWWVQQTRAEVQHPRNTAIYSMSLVWYQSASSIRWPCTTYVLLHIYTVYIFVPWWRSHICTIVNEVTAETAAFHRCMSIHCRVDIYIV